MQVNIYKKTARIKFETVEEIEAFADILKIYIEKSFQQSHDFINNELLDTDAMILEMAKIFIPDDVVQMEQ